MKGLVSSMRVMILGMVLLLALSAPASARHRGDLWIKAAVEAVANHLGDLLYDPVLE